MKRYLVSWSARFVDFDRDAALELILVNGNFGLPPCATELSQPDFYFRAMNPGWPFADITRDVGFVIDATCEDPDIPINGRGLAVGDLDGDGDDDLVISPHAEDYRFLRNDTPSCGRHFVRVRLRGTVSSPDPVGAVLTVERTDGLRVRRTLYGGGDTYSQSDRVLEVGLDSATDFASATVLWPSGLVQRVDSALAIDAEVTLVEPEWLRITDRDVAAADPAPELVYTPAGGGPERTVVVKRADGSLIPATKRADGSYAAPLPHPGQARRETFLVSIDGVWQRPRLSIRYR
jgi:hypothetical protein